MVVWGVMTENVDLASSHRLTRVVLTGGFVRGNAEPESRCGRVAVVPAPGAGSGVGREVRALLRPLWGFRQLIPIPPRGQRRPRLPVNGRLFTHNEQKRTDRGSL